MKGPPTLPEPLPWGLWTDEERSILPWVLMSMLRLGDVEVPSMGCRGLSLDYAAREPLWGERGLTMNTVPDTG